MQVINMAFRLFSILLLSAPCVVASEWMIVVGGNYNVPIWTALEFPSQPLTREITNGIAEGGVFRGLLEPTLPSVSIIIQEKVFPLRFKWDQDDGGTIPLFVPDLILTILTRIKTQTKTQVGLQVCLTDFHDPLDATVFVRPLKVLKIVSEDEGVRARVVRLSNTLAQSVLKAYGDKGAHFQRLAPSASNPELASFWKDFVFRHPAGLVGNVRVEADRGIIFLSVADGRSAGFHDYLQFLAR